MVMVATLGCKGYGKGRQNTTAAHLSVWNSVEVDDEGGGEEER